MTAKEKQPNWLASKLIGDELVSKIKDLDPQQLSWLSGYCAGLLESSGEADVEINPVSSAADVSVEAAATIKPVLVIYVSQTGNAQQIAQSLHQNLSANQVDAILKSSLDIKPKELKDYSAILVTASTHGEGEPPDDAIEFHEAMTSKKGAKKRPSLDGVKHAVLGLGDSSYEFFCQTAKDFDLALANSGSASLLEPVLCDVDYEEDAEGWINHVTASLKDYISSLGGTSQPGVVKTINTEADPVHELSYDKNNPFTATVETIQRITGQGSLKETYHVEIDITDSGMVYEPGDAVGVIAHNKLELVDEVLELLSLDANENVIYKGKNTSLKSYLTQTAELTLINKATVKSLLELTSNDELQTIHDKEFGDFIDKHQFVDVLHIVKPKLSAQELVDILKPIKPRLYSISSSLEEFPDEVHLTLNHVSNSNQFGHRYGLASHFLTQSLEEGEAVSIFIDKNQKFKVPKDESPLIMVGPGTGVAPFRAFLQHREALANSGKNWLFFGNPHFNTDFLYQVEMQSYLKSGTLSKLDLAFSRDSEDGEKVYVQQKLLDNAEEVWQWLEQGAYFYVCGDMHRMAKDVESALIDIIKSQGGKGEAQAKEYLKQLKLDNRYQRDIY
ncbi:assimilatory sulfite reductase (NADPH) flavoprotein subunit [Kangiella sp. HD9-110m-PIT-SAG07]|nr:assimilatory sulfite reductase (NADPH) flavoprotein subunit [Kangiella sp. HD9-110m-PIT-SAG07]